MGIKMKPSSTFGPHFSLLTVPDNYFFLLVAPPWCMKTSFPRTSEDERISQGNTPSRRMVMCTRETLRLTDHTCIAPNNALSSFSFFISRINHVYRRRCVAGEVGNLIVTWPVLRRITAFASLRAHYIMRSHDSIWWACHSLMFWMKAKRSKRGKEERVCLSAGPALIKLFDTAFWHGPLHPGFRAPLIFPTSEISYSYPM